MGAVLYVRLSSWTGYLTSGSMRSRQHVFEAWQIIGFWQCAAVQWLSTATTQVGSQGQSGAPDVVGMAELVISLLSLLHYTSTSQLHINE